MSGKDTIYRQDAIDVAKAHWYKPDIAGAIEQLPSAQPERQKGYMKIEANMIDGEDVICETCGAYCLSPLYNFCPICGIEFIGVRGIQDE